MLKFFRKIRWRLAANNQFFKYSRYAIGEIVLVVIGILIALQINNWNEERKDIINKKLFKRALIEDLQKDTANQNHVIQVAEIHIKVFGEIITKLEKPDVTFDTIVKLYTSGSMSKMGILPPNKTTFQSLMSTGNIKVFTEDEIQELMNFYDNIKLRYHLIQYRYDYSYEKYQELNDKFGFLWKNEKNGPVYKILRKEVNEAEFIRMYDLALHRFLQASRSAQEHSEQLLILTNELIETLSLDPD
ncbi:hypothetical protein LCM02_08290 [Lutimonas saemankumensis]|uniref:DUF6090 family protein n=1 Tax=Lutimonas saemankumensis TaxID=483016 RepID=UPI001CD81468|nr:DUF6090 family protein [Lutimonas saemankumensis]MCA0932447.1 hypothetical protein [Lutimonas saemankumensis]